MATKEEKIALYAEAILNEIGHDKVDDELLVGVVDHLGPNVFLDDAELVSQQDHEFATIKDSYLKGKLELDDMPEEQLDAAIDEAIDQYGRSHRNKYRAVIYYLLAQKLKREHLLK